MSRVSYLESRRGLRLLQAVASLSALLLLAVLLDGGLEAAPKPDFGPNVLIFSPSLPSATIQQQINKVWDAQGNSQFGSGRYALLFLPGTYTLDVPIGYYTQVLGLGASPD